MAGRQSRPRKTVAARRARVLAMKAAGVSYTQIAASIRDEFELPNYYRDSAAKDLARALEDARDSLSELAGLHLTLELERLDGYTRTAETIMRQALGAGDRWGALRALDRLVTFGARRDALLGLTSTSRAVRADAGDEGDDADAADVLDEVGRKRANRRRAYAG